MRDIGVFMRKPKPNNVKTDLQKLSEAVRNLIVVFVESYHLDKPLKWLEEWLNE